MKLKGVSFFEQHVEKIVLGSVSAIFLGVVAMQFLYEPNKIKVGGAPPLAPGRAFEPVRAKAELVRAKMDMNAEDLGLPQVPKVDLADGFKRRHDAPIAPVATITPLGKGREVQGTLGPDMGAKEGQRLAVVVIPAPTPPVAVSHRHTIDPTESLSNPELKKLLPADQPMDKASVSVEASFDGTALRAALLTGKGEGSPYPPGWWREMELLGAKLERQEQGAGGEWGAAEVVPPPPGRGIPDLVKNVRGAADMPDLLGTARGAAEDLLRPAYYRVIAGTPWKPPSEAAKGSDVGRVGEIRKLIEQRATLIKDQDRIKKQLETAGAPPPPPRGGGGGGGGGGKGGGGGQQPPSADPDAERRRQEARTRPLQEQLKKTEEKLTKNESDLKALGVDTEGNLLPAGALVENAPPTAPKSLLDNPAVTVWAHDLTAAPGKSYRYRVTVLVSNPAFGRGAFLIPEQQDLAKSPIVESTPSDWTAPLTVLGERYFFITSATEADQQGPSHATAELYQFFYGYYRQCTVYLEPGDILAGPVKLPDPAKLPIYDLLKLAAAEPGQPAIAPPGQQPPGRGPNIPAQLRPGREGQTVVDERGGGKGGGRQVAGGPPAQEGTTVVLPEHAKPWAGGVRVDFDNYLLDVARVPGATTGVRTQTYLRGPDGSIIARGTAGEEKSDIYRVLAASAKDGENQGQPVAPIIEKKPDVLNPAQDPRQPPPPKGPPGGGGGGGGGGG